MWHIMYGMGASDDASEAHPAGQCMLRATAQLCDEFNRRGIEFDRVKNIQCMGYAYNTTEECSQSTAEAQAAENAAAVGEGRSPDKIPPITKVVPQYRVMAVGLCWMPEKSVSVCEDLQEPAKETPEMESLLEKFVHGVSLDCGDVLENSSVPAPANVDDDDCDVQFVKL